MVLRGVFSPFYAYRAILFVTMTLATSCTKAGSQVQLSTFQKTLVPTMSLNSHDSATSSLKLSIYTHHRSGAERYLTAATSGPKFVAFVVTNISQSTTFANISLDFLAPTASFTSVTNLNLYPIPACGNGRVGKVFSLNVGSECLILVQTIDLKGDNSGVLDLGETTETTLRLQYEDQALATVNLTAKKIVYVGGGFTQFAVPTNQTGPTPVSVTRSAVWDQSTWVSSNLPDPTPFVAQTYETVRLITVDPAGNIYAVDTGHNTDGIPGQTLPTLVSRLLRWDGVEWEVIADNISGGIHALASDEDGHLYVGGEFNTIGGISLANLAKYTPNVASRGGRWSAVGNVAFSNPSDRQLSLGDESGNGNNWRGLLPNSIKASTGVTALRYVPASSPHPYAGQLLVGGQFLQVQGQGLNQTRAFAARWNPKTSIWSAVGIPDGFCANHKSEIWSFLPTRDNGLYIGGHFWVESGHTGSGAVNCSARPDFPYEGPQSAPLPDLAFAHLAVVLPANINDPTPVPQAGFSGVPDTNNFDGPSQFRTNPTGDDFTHASGIFTLLEQPEGVYVGGGIDYRTSLQCESAVGRTYTSLGSFFVLKTPTANDGDLSSCPTNYKIAAPVEISCDPARPIETCSPFRHMTPRGAVLSLVDGMGIRSVGQTGLGENMFIGGSFISAQFLPSVPSSFSANDLDAGLTKWLTGFANSFPACNTTGLGVGDSLHCNLFRRSPGQATAPVEYSVFKNVSAAANPPFLYPQGGPVWTLTSWYGITDIQTNISQN